MPITIEQNIPSQIPAEVRDSTALSPEVQNHWQRVLAMDTQDLSYGLELQAPLTDEIPISSTTLISVENVSLMVPASPDPTGFTLDPARKLQYIVDSEVEETIHYAGANFWARNFDGTIVYTATTVAISKEPTAIRVMPDGNIAFVDDDKHRLVIVTLGPEGRFRFLPEDIVSVFDLHPKKDDGTKEIIVDDAESLAINEQGEPVLADAGNKETITTLHLGETGTYTSFTTIDTSVLGEHDAEGLTFIPQTGTYVMISNEQEQFGQFFATEFSITNGEILPMRKIDLRDMGLRAPGDIFAYTLEDGRRVMVITDRGYDNNQNGHADENDGKLFTFEYPKLEENKVYLPIILNLGAQPDTASYANIGSSVMDRGNGKLKHPKRDTDMRILM